MRHLLGMGDLDADELVEVLDVADAFVEVGRRSNPKVPALRGRTVATVFFESSTRTRVSFETAAKRLSADVLSFSAGTSSLNKGESLRDTIETIESMGIDALVIRHAAAGVPVQVARWLTSTCVVNAGDGAHEHPTQALIDLLTIRQVRDPGGTGVGCFAGLGVTIVGDIRHSRVARSQVCGLARLGARVTLVAPATLLPPSLEGWPIQAVGHDLDAVLPTTDVVSLLRVQEERGSGTYLPSLREYAHDYSLTAARAALLPPDAVVLHPGPVIRGVEVAPEVLDLPAVLVRRQVSNGVAVRMAVLFLLLGNGDRPSLGSGGGVSLSGHGTDGADGTDGTRSDGPGPGRQDAARTVEVSVVDDG